MSNRVKYIDVMRAIGIILVVLGHCIDASNPLKKVIYSFHMSIFFVILGLLLKFEYRNIKEYTIKKFFQLIIPYLIWSFMYSGISEKTIPLILYGTRKSIIAANGLSSLWFLVAYFGTSVIVQFIINISIKFKRNKLFFNANIIILTIIGFILSNIVNLKYNIPLEIDVSLQMLIFILLGYYLKNAINIIKSKLKNPKYLILLSIVSVVLIGLTILTSFLNNSVNYVIVADALYGNIIFIIPAILGSIATLLISLLITNFDKLSNLLALLGKNTIGILCTHKVIIAFISGIIEKYISIKSISIFVIFIISFSLSFILSVIIDRFLPNLIGKRIEVNKTQKDYNLEEAKN